MPKNRKTNTISHNNWRSCKMWYCDFNVELYCLCRVPYAPPTDERYEMAQCNQCKEWFHRVCEKIPAFENLQFAVTDINSKNDKYLLSLNFSCPLVTKGHTHTWTNLQLLPFVTTRHERDKRDNFPRKSILDVFGNKSTPIIPNLPIFIASLNSCYHQF